MSFSYNDHWLPLTPDHAVRRGWQAPINHRPQGVTWHWTAGHTLADCRRTLGGASPTRKGEASAHYAVGRSSVEGVDCYVSLDNRSWHAGTSQTLRWDGKPCNEDFKGSRATIGVETVNIGYARDGVPAGPGWIRVGTANGRKILEVQPWTDEQLVMMVAVGKEIIARWPHIEVRDHHGHSDVCPGYKEDVAGFPFAQVLRGIYGDPTIPDVWSPVLLPLQRQKALRLLGYDLGTSGPAGDGVDGRWGSASDRALTRFQEDHGLVPNAMWSTFVCWAVHDACVGRGIDLSRETAELVA